MTATRRLWRALISAFVLRLGFVWTVITVKSKVVTPACSELQVNQSQCYTIVTRLEVVFPFHAFGPVT